MVEVSPLTLFLTFFKSILNRILCFGIISISFYSSNLQAEASNREITLYPTKDIRVFDDTNHPNKTFRLALTESIINFDIAPCFFILNQIPILYSVLQAGVSCATALSKRDALSFEVIPESNFRGSKPNYSLTIGINNAFDLTNGQKIWLFQSSLYYKFWDNEQLSSPADTNTRQLLQLWGNVFDSNFTIGFIYNDKLESKENDNSFSGYFYYKQSLPLAWRQIGGARNSAAIEYKAIGASLRKESFNFLVYGLGLAFWTLTYDGIRVSAPLPEIYLAIDF